MTNLIRTSFNPILLFTSFHLQSFNGYMTPCTYAIIWIKNRGYRIETNHVSGLPYDFIVLFTRVPCHNKSVCGGNRKNMKSRSASLSIAYSVATSFNVFIIYTYDLFFLRLQCSLCRFPDCSMLSKIILAECFVKARSLRNGDSANGSVAASP